MQPLRPHVIDVHAYVAGRGIVICYLSNMLSNKSFHRIILESWRRHYNTVRPNPSLAYEQPAPDVFIPVMGARSTP